MNGRILLEKLQTLTEEQLNLPVFIAGCDCDGTAHEVQILAGEIYITRSD